MKSTLGRTLRFLRQVRGIKQNHLSKSIGISQSYLSRIENDKVQISHVRVTEIAAVIGVTLLDNCGEDITFDKSNIVDINIKIITSVFEDLEIENPEMWF